MITIETASSVSPSVVLLEFSLIRWWIPSQNVVIIQIKPVTVNIPTLLRDQESFILFA